MLINLPFCCFEFDLGRIFCEKLKKISNFEKDKEKIKEGRRKNGTRRQFELQM